MKSIYIKLKKTEEKQLDTIVNYRTSTNNRGGEFMENIENINENKSKKKKNPLDINSHYNSLDYYNDIIYK